ncbi:hypothetical protein ACVWXL_009243 [Bradyrhizobium sp. GM22.5]
MTDEIMNLRALVDADLLREMMAFGPAFDGDGGRARKMLLTLIPYPLRRPVGDADTDSRKSGFQPTLRPAPPTHGFPPGAGQHLFLPRSIGHLVRGVFAVGPEPWYSAKRASHNSDKP